MIPKELFSSGYTELSIAAKLVYCFLLERHNMSVRNGWEDTDGKAFIYYPTEALAKILQVNRNTVGKFLRELEGCNLITRVKQGLGRPDKIKVKPLVVEREYKSDMVTYDIAAYEKLINS